MHRRRSRRQHRGHDEEQLIDAVRLEERQAQALLFRLDGGVGRVAGGRAKRRDDLAEGACRGCEQGLVVLKLCLHGAHVRFRLGGFSVPSLLQDDDAGRGEGAHKAHGHRDPDGEREAFGYVQATPPGTIGVPGISHERRGGRARAGSLLTSPNHAIGCCGRGSRPRTAPAPRLGDARLGLFARELRQVVASASAGAGGAGVLPATEGLAVDDGGR